MVSSQLHYTKVNRFMPFLLAEIMNFQGSIHQYGVGCFSYNYKKYSYKSKKENHKSRSIKEEKYGTGY